MFNDFVILLVVIDPINVIPAFMLFTQYDSPEARKRTALRAVVIAAVTTVAKTVDAADVSQFLLDLRPL